MEIQRIIRYALSLVLTVVFLLHVGEVLHAPILTSLENQAYDARLKITLPDKVDKQVVIVDIDEKTWNMDPSLLEAAITDKTKAIMPVHLFGQAVDLDGLLALADALGVLLVTPTLLAWFAALTFGIATLYIGVKP